MGLRQGLARPTGGGLPGPPRLPMSADGPWSWAKDHVASYGQDRSPPSFWSTGSPACRASKDLQGAPSSWSPPSSRPPRRGCAQLCVWCLFLSHESAAEAVGTRPRAQALGQMPVSGVMGTRPQTPRGACTSPLAAESLSFSHVRGHLLLRPHCCLSVCLWGRLRVGCM